MIAPTIETERLRLRMFTPDDLDDLARLYADREAMQYIGTGQPLSREKAEIALQRTMEHWHNHGFGGWAVGLKESGKFIGRAGLFYLDNTPEIEVG